MRQFWIVRRPFLRKLAPRLLPPKEMLFDSTAAHRSARFKGDKRLGLALASLITIMGAACVFYGLLAPNPTVESQVANALGCRNNSTILILKLNDHGEVLWPDGSTATVANSQLLMFSWHERHRHEEPIVALLADADTPMSLAHPLLATMQELGLQRAIFATSQNSEPKLIANTR